VTDISLGSSGILPISKNEAKPDIFGGHNLGGNDVIVDSIAAMAGNTMGASNEMTPVAIFRGLKYEPWDDEKPLKICFSILRRLKHMVDF
jgi:coenzyme F420-0:L-glutamate ligase/coenzyme F420-1:gamma-L-glutamate ligase